ncbi:hypothetical protein Afil01_56020 [Actinorhabdospora filicis]|uniref:Streptomycin 6-kinase n=1 Tax=Actinorhabdospora filicis TaxID=1785913 RepID=A0A9W6WDG0_9ACTN|nr:aminoglycoside phosphotransferase family protein [Actinorhabdospora filicis]GLZ80795.1 hypothetical protein Afil01_56020 [Actinorhabdospora filicis]
MISPVVAAKLAALGPAGDAWQAALPALLDDLSREWDLELGEPLDGGTAGLVLRVRAAGRDAVLKLAIPWDNAAGEIRTLLAARGRGYVRVLAADPGRLAMLQESLGDSAWNLPPVDAAVTLTGVLREAWTLPLDIAPEVTPATHKAAQLAEMVIEMWEAQDRPCPRRVVGLALEYARRRAAAFDPSACVVVHGDPHPGNALRRGDGFVFVDPDGFRCEPAYDLGVILRDWPDLMLADTGLADRVCDALARESGLDRAAIWEWGFLERVSTGLYLERFGRDGSRFLDSAGMLADRV